MVLLSNSSKSKKLPQIYQIISFQFINLWYIDISKTFCDLFEKRKALDIKHFCANPIMFWNHHLIKNTRKIIIMEDMMVPNTVIMLTNWILRIIAAVATIESDKILINSRYNGIVFSTRYSFFFLKKIEIRFFPEKNSYLVKFETVNMSASENSNQIEIIWCSFKPHAL